MSQPPRTEPSPPALWPGKRWTLALLLAAMSSLGPFSIDTYLPAFAEIADTVGASPAQMQQTLSAYLLGFAVMNLFHGALADSYGRRPVLLAGMAVFALASVGCALADSAGTLIFWRAVQGLSAGSGMVISRAIIRDLYKPADAQRVMSQVTIFFGVSPALAPLLGGLMVGPLGWRSIFWLLAALGIVLLVANARLLPETLQENARQSFRPRPLLQGYGSMLRNPRFLALVLSSSVPFNGFFLYVLAAPTWLGEHLKLAPAHFFWFFCVTVAGIMGGAWLSGRMAGRLPPRRQVQVGFAVIGGASLLNVLLNAALVPHVAWAFVPVGLYSFGWSLLTPVITLLLLDQAPDRRGMASSVQSSLGSAGNALVAGVLVPLVMHSTMALALASLAMMLGGLLAWIWVRRRVT